jgi:flagellar basal body-associated protein FliL
MVTQNSGSRSAPKLNPNLKPKIDPKPAGKAAPKGAAKANGKDHFVVYLIAIVVIGLAAIAIFVFIHVAKAGKPVAPQFTYSKFGPYQVEAQNYAIGATLAVQTSNDDTGWAKENEKTLNTIFRKLLADNVTAATLKSPSGLQDLQTSLAKGANATLGGNRVQTVLLTDFIMQTRDQSE